MAARSKAVLVGAVQAAALAGAALTGCDDASVREQRVPKGVEPVEVQDAVVEQAPALPPEQAPRAEPAPVWTAPAGGEASGEARPMRVATFIAQVEGRPVEIAVTRFEGEAGGILANVNRWRGQMGLPEVDEAGLDAAVTRFGSDGWAGYMVRVEGAPQHMLAAGVFERAANRTWFVRATGTPAELDAIEGDFGSFVRSLGQAGLP